ncbi:THUMP domain-containing class I SAM-dependent RNA methyltransferase [Solirhodobacter olei]|uniref:THUMP domain-containing class I SAM-dependent RNA methyltransferase n=1 Tax=Solirhodobacter olei TaxID=2493082 RepID=UPI000FDCA086|nr:class I SAM-dependent RNA methyltransferase [Solirhodobacter olei]
MTDALDIFLATAPGLEATLAEEAREAGFADPTPVPGGVTTRGDWPEVWRANLVLRGASRVLVRIGGFRALHLAQLDKRARKFPWAETLRPDVAVKVEATCRASKIYHAGAAAQRISRAIAETLGAPIAKPGEDTPALRLLARIEDDLVTFSLDTSGAPLHQRGHKLEVGKAPMRETLAALFLRQCGYTGTEPVVDPMCGSGTFILEAAEIALGLAPGRGRPFAFEEFASFDAKAWAALRTPAAPRTTGLLFHGSDRDQGVIRAAEANAARAGLSEVTRFTRQPASELTPPEGPPGLVIVNPPYGARIGEKKPLFALYGSLGRTLTERFSGWRAAIVTSEPQLAHATGLPFLPAGPPIPHGGLKIRLYQTKPLP